MGALAGRPRPRPLRRATPRIKALMFFSGGTSNNEPFVYISADRDIGGTTTPTSLAGGHRRRPRSPGPGSITTRSLENRWRLDRAPRAHGAAGPRGRHDDRLVAVHAQGRPEGPRPMFVGDSCGPLQQGHRVRVRPQTRFFSEGCSDIMFPRHIMSRFCSGRDYVARSRETGAPARMRGPGRLRNGLQKRRSARPSRSA